MQTNRACRMIVVGLALLSAVPVFAEDGEKKTVDPALEAPAVNTTPGPEYARRHPSLPGHPGDRARSQRAALGDLVRWRSDRGTGGTMSSWSRAATMGKPGRNRSLWSIRRRMCARSTLAFGTIPRASCGCSGRRGSAGGTAGPGVWAITADDSGKEDTAWSKPRRLCNGIMMNKPTVPLHR